jgi:hypothetical protein
MRSRPKLGATVALLAAMLVLAFSPGAGGATRGDDPRSLAVQVVKWNFLAQYGPIWELLHPRYQAVTTRTFCVQKAGDTTYWIRYQGTWKGLWRLAEYQAYSHHRCPS